jgi:hypothetical protein
VILAVVLVVLICVALVAAVAWPLLRPAPEAEPGGPPDDDDRRELDEALERSLAAIREIEFDHRAGHLSDADYQSLDREERQRAVDLIRRRDELGER